MKFYWGDYLKDTTHLVALEHAAYLLLIGAMWQAKGKLPTDDVILARHARMTPKEWASVKGVVLPLFKVSRGHLTHKRIAAELSKYSDVVQKRKVAGKKGGSVSDGKDLENSQANASQKPSKRPHNQNQNQKKDRALNSPITSSGASANLRHGGALAPPPVVIDFDALRDRLGQQSTDSDDERATG